MSALTESKAPDRPSETVTLDELTGSVRPTFSDGPAWVQLVREAAFQRVRRVGLPAHSDEAWRSTDPRPLLNGSYRLRLPGTSEQALEMSAPLPVEAAIHLVFVDGAYAPGLSRVSGPPPGVEIALLEEAEISFADRLRPVMARDVADARDGLELLGASLLGCGVFIRVSRGSQVDLPIVLSFRETKSSDNPTLVSPRIIVVAEEGAHVRIIEDHLAAEGARGLTLGTTSLDVAAESRVSHAMIERSATSWNVVNTLRIRQEADSRLVSHRLLAGGGTVRNNVVASLVGKRANAEFNGLFLPEGRQNHDNNLRVEHVAPNCTSRQHYRGLPADRGRGVFTGRIHVDPQAQKTDAVQSNDNLLLSDRAEIRTRPQLEIYADDVRCTHGATTGQLDEDALFYLRARGLEERASRLMLLHAFAGAVIDRIEYEPLRDWTRTLVGSRLGRALERSEDGSNRLASQQRRNDA